MFSLLKCIFFILEERITWCWGLQFRGGSELLVEAGDQRRSIHLPRQIQGKVGGAKFVDRRLVITMR